MFRFYFCFYTTFDLIFKRLYKRLTPNKSLKVIYIYLPFIKNIGRVMNSRRNRFFSMINSKGPL